MENSRGGLQLHISSTNNPETLWDTLSTDTLAVIVKRMCSRPRTVRNTASLPWAGATYITPKTRKPLRFLALLFSENSPFRGAAATLVSRIELSWSDPEFCISASTKTLTVGPEIFEAEAKAVGLGRSIISACGPYVRTIRTVSDIEDEVRAKNLLEQFTRHVFQYCRNVEEAELWGCDTLLIESKTASAFFREYAANLRVVEWNGQDEEEASFTDLEKCVKLRRLSLNYPCTATLVSLLKACGSTLEEIVVPIQPEESVEAIEAIRKYCKKLSVIQIETLEEIIEMGFEECYTSLLCSYGSQLKKAETLGLGYEHLVEVANICTNLEVTVPWLPTPSMGWQHVIALGPRVASLSFLAEALHGAEYPRALDRVSNLRELHVSIRSAQEGLGATDEMIANVFSPSRFPKLEQLHMECFVFNERNMSLIASSTGYLRCAVFREFKFDSGMSAFKFIADSNLHLEDITMHISEFHVAAENAGTALHLLSELVNTFCKCRKLRFGIASSAEGELAKEDLIRICKVLPCRDVDVIVRIGGVYYQYPN